ncbi:MAG TPA: hypothetical protein VFK05_07595 [Polyangiaceae bacterium]|nr:hypothetical protein [Polyangiaceae bacterium]
MLRHAVVRAFFVSFAALVLAGCGSDDSNGNGSCSAPSVKGTALGLDGGMGAVHGTGQLPSGVTDGKELLVIVDGGNNSGNIVAEGLTPTPLTCGKSFSFEAKKLPAGTYHIGYEVDDDNFNVLFEGTSTNSFTITASENLEFNPTFP